MPKGVAALPSPKKLAARLRAIGERGMVGGYLGKERAKDGPDQLDQGVHDPRVFGDLEQAEEKGEHADQAKRDARGGLGEVERRSGDGIELDEPDRLEDNTGRDGNRRVRRLGGGEGREALQAALQLLVARARDLGDRGQRLGKFGAGSKRSWVPSRVCSR